MAFCSGLERKREIGARGRDADDALIAALKAKMQWPEAEIMYVRRANKRGDAWHPAHVVKTNC